MRLKMLVGLAGLDYNLQPGDETERFADKEARRLIKHGIAEQAPPPPVKKPETKKEWDDEREALLASNADLTAKLEASQSENEGLRQTVAQFDALKGAFAQIAAASETAVTAPAAEIR